jgi:hypothetical protein
VRAEPGVVVDGVVGEVLGDPLGVPRVERLVVGPDVVEMRDGGIFTVRCRFELLAFVVRVKAANRRRAERRKR